MIWKTIQEFADLDTGEQIPKKLVTNGTYVKVKTITNYEKRSDTYGIRKLATGCRRSNQTKLF